MSDRSRRKSLSILHPSLSPLTPINGPSSPKSPTMLQKKRRTIPFGFSSPLSSSPSTDGATDTAASSPTTSFHSLRRVGSKASMERLMHKARPKSQQKAGRPSSLFGSLRSLNSLQDDDGNALVRTTSTPTSTNSEKLNSISESEILLHGEVQTAGSLFRKKSQYFVLTDTHLVRFKSQSRAADIFPSIPSSFGKASGIRHSRMSSNGSLHELQASSSSAETYVATLLNQIVAVYKLDDGRPFFSVQISWLDEETMYASETTLQLHDPTDSELWLSSIRGAAMKARLKNPLPFTQHLVEWTARALEQERDYDPRQFHMFKVVQRASKAGGRSSTDDLTKLTSNICILAIGIFKVHLIPLPKMSRSSSSTSLSDLMGAVHGVTTLTAVVIQTTDDSFSLTFRTPLCQPVILCLASFCSTDIALWMRQAAEYLRPEWIEQPFTWNVPQSLDDVALTLPITSVDEYSCFSRTLRAYCAGYNINNAMIQYEVISQCEDAPTFQLLPPTDGRRAYSVLELLAIMRALRYNESFGCISFRNISLDPLRDQWDRDGDDHVPWTTRSGEDLDVGDQSKFTLIVQEVQALACKSKRLRRLDFSFCLTINRTRHPDIDSGCGLCEALFPLCAKQYTNVDWIVLNGIYLKDVDLDYLYGAIIDKKCHFRAVDVAYCDLAERNLDLVLHGLSHQFPTLESLDISGNPARLESSWHSSIKSLEFMRKLHLSNICRRTEPEPLVAPDLLISWKLEEIILDETTLNTETTDALASYLSHPQSQFLKLLSMKKCKLTGNQAADLLSAQHKGTKDVRKLHIQLSENLLEQGHEHLAKAISRNWTPVQMTMQMIEYRTESNFRALLTAFVSNQTTRWLDIAKVSLPCDAYDETCAALGSIFAFNESLEYLDISGEKTHIEAANFGRGLHAALGGLAGNKTLKTLIIQHQSLGLQGANVIASVLETNACLEELQCEDNEINLQGFTIMVNSMEENTTLRYLPSMDADRMWAQQKVEREVRDVRDRKPSSSVNMATTTATVMKSLGVTTPTPRLQRVPERSSLPQDGEIRAAVESVWRNWDREVARLQKYLERNRALVHGLPPEGSGTQPVDGPETGDGLATPMQGLDLEKTPTVELNLQLGFSMEEATDGTTPHASPRNDEIEREQGDEGEQQGEGAGVEEDDRDETDDPLEISQS